MILTIFIRVPIITWVSLRTFTTNTLKYIFVQIKNGLKPTWMGSIYFFFPFRVNPEIYTPRCELERKRARRPRDREGRPLGPLPSAPGIYGLHGPFGRPSHSILAGDKPLFRAVVRMSPFPARFFLRLCPWKMTPLFADRRSVGEYRNL